MRIIVLSLTLFLSLANSLACTAAPEPGEPDCTSRGVLIVPTPTRPTDPDLSQPPQLPGAGGDGRIYCATPMPHSEESEPLVAFVTTEVVNLSLLIDDQDLAALAVGEDMLAVAWLTDGDLFWEQVASFPIPSDEDLTGPVGLDFTAVSEDEAWVYAAWVTKRPFPQPPIPPYSQPLYEAANPFFPYQIGNPHHIYQGLNAARWGSDGTPFDGGCARPLTCPTLPRPLPWAAGGWPRPLPTTCSSVWG
jgi:hypothetical protein